MNLYATTKPGIHIPRPVNSHTLYLASLAKENPDVDTKLKVISVVSSQKGRLYIVSSAGKFYLTEKYVENIGMENIILVSSSLGRIQRYAYQLLGITS